MVGRGFHVFLGAVLMLLGREIVHGMPVTRYNKDVIARSIFDEEQPDLYARARQGLRAAKTRRGSPPARVMNKNAIKKADYVEACKVLKLKNVDPSKRKAAEDLVEKWVKRKDNNKQWMRAFRLKKEMKKVDGSSQPSTSPTQPSTSPTQPSTSRTQSSGIGQTPSNPHAPPPSTGSNHPATHPYADIITEEQWHSALFDKPLT